METCIHAKQDIFGCFYLRGSSSSIISSGCGSGSDKLCESPGVPYKSILSVQSCPGMSTWHPGLELAPLSRPAGDFVQSLQENAALLTVHRPSGSHPASLEGLGEVLGLPEFLERNSNNFYLQQVKLGCFSFPISFCRFCCFSGFSPAI